MVTEIDQVLWLQKAGRDRTEYAPLSLMKTAQLPTHQPRESPQLVWQTLQKMPGFNKPPTEKVSSLNPDELNVFLFFSAKLGGYE